MQESAATLLRGGAEQGEEPGRSPGPPSRDTGERGRSHGPFQKAKLEEASTSKTALSTLGTFTAG